MEITELEIKLLNLLADEWEKSGPPGYLETKILAQRLDVTVWKTKSAIKSLFVKGLVDADELDTYMAPDAGRVIKRQGAESLFSRHKSLILNRSRSR